MLQPTAVSTALFQIILPDASGVGVTIANLRTLPLRQVTVEGKTEEGPRLLDVLNFAVLFGMIGGLLGAPIVLDLRCSL